MGTDVNAWEFTRGCTDTERKCALKVDSGREIPFHTEGSNLRQRRADPILYRLSYIPAPLDFVLKRAGHVEAF